LGTTNILDMDDNDPNNPGSKVDVFTPTGLLSHNFLESELDDGFHPEGGICSTVIASPTPSPTASATATPCTECTPTPTATAAPTPTPRAGAGDTVADMVFGQNGSFTTGGCNQGGISASTICTSADAIVDSHGNLYASDFSNNRVLQYNDALAEDSVADGVFGQFNFTSNTCNTNGFGSAPTSTTLCGPQGVTVDGAGNLYIADYNNNRILEFDNPLATDMLPDRVFGQAGNFETGGCNMRSFPSASSICGPNDVTVDGAGNLYVAESANNRVLEYDNPLATDTVADRVFGQFGNFTSNGCNTGGRGSPPDARTMCFPIGVAVDGSGNLYVVDRDNSRVLQYNDPLATDTVADGVFGQPDFTSNRCNTAGLDTAPAANTLCSPQGVAIDPRTICTFPTQPITGSYGTIIPLHRTRWPMRCSAKREALRRACAIPAINLVVQ